MVSMAVISWILRRSNSKRLFFVLFHSLVDNPLFSLYYKSRITAQNNINNSKADRPVGQAVTRSSLKREIWC